jgi:predicted  nucleic acid-binding Zn-ribbon protein
MRRCTECGYTWPVTDKEHARWNQVEEADLRAYPYREIRSIRERVTAEAEDDIEVREALSHCPQCGARHFTEYREDEPKPKKT